MRFKVIVPFRFRGNVVKTGQPLEADGQEAARLLAARVVGIARPEQAVRPPAEQPEAPKPERAVKPPAERRTRKRKADDGSGTDSSAGD